MALVKSGPSHGMAGGGGVHQRRSIIMKRGQYLCYGHRYPGPADKTMANLALSDSNILVAVSQIHKDYHQGCMVGLIC